MRLLALDPGVTTGWAIMYGNPKTASTPRILKCGEAYSAGEVVRLIHTAVKRLKCDTVVAEAYVPTRAPMSRASIVTCETIGSIKLAAAVVGVTLIMQSPSARTAFRRRVPGTFGLKTPSTSKHALDAIAHGWRYFADVHVGRYG